MHMDEAFMKPTMD